MTAIDSDDRRTVARLLGLCCYYSSLLPEWPDVPATGSVGLEIKQLEEWLVEIWSVLTETTIANHPGWRADSEHPGYAATTVGESQVHVPFFLLPDFPKGSRLSVLSDLGHRLRIQGKEAGSAICISGSTTFSDGIRQTCDLDYCEYVAVAGRSEHRRLAARLIGLARVVTDDLGCTSFRLGGTPSEGWEYPFVKDWANEGEDSRRLLAALTRADRGMFKFLHVGDREDLVEATNVFLLVAPGSGEQGAQRWSFAAQEAPLTESGWLPRRLACPVALGRYGTWLAGEVERLATQDTPKAAKRGVSLARVFGWWETSESLTGLLRDSGAALHSALKARLSLETACSEVATLRPDRRRFREAWRTTVQRLAQEAGIPSLAGIREALEVHWNEVAERFVSPAQAVLGGLVGEVRKMASSDGPQGEERV